MMSSRRCLPVGFRRAFQAAALLLLMSVPAAAQAPAGPAPTKTSTGPVLAAFVAAPGIRRTPGHVPLVLKIYNNSNKSIRLLDLFTPKLFPVAVRFNLEPSGTPGSGASLFYGLKASLYSWQYVYITVKPHHAFQTSFDLAQMTWNKQPIPAGKYKLSGWYSGGNMGYPSGMGSDADVFNGGADIPPIDLIVDKPASAQVPAASAPRQKTADGFHLAVSIPHRNVYVAEPILLTITVTNTSSKPASYVETGIYNDFSFGVTDEKNTPVPKTLYGKSRLFPAGSSESTMAGFRHLAAGQKLTYRIFINALFDMTLAQVYHLAVKRKFSDAGLEEAASNTVVVEVLGEKPDNQ